jgi:hypothetical protein
LRKMSEGAASTRERETEGGRAGGRFASSFLSRRQLLHSDVMIKGPSVFFESTLFCRAPGCSRSRSECPQLFTPPRKYCRESYSTQNKQNHNQLITKAGLESLLHFLQVQKTGTRKRETQTDTKRDIHKLWNATNRRR